MSAEEHNRYFKILELNPDALLSDVVSSYQYLKTLYSADSMVTSAIIYDFSEESRQDVLRQIEEAYAKLLDFFENKEKESRHKDRPVIVNGDKLKEHLADVSSFSGLVLRQIREKLGVELKDMAIFTKIRRQYFEDIELEKFSAFPAEVYLSGYLAAYARYLSLDPVKVAADYLNRYRSWKNAREERV